MQESIFKDLWRKTIGSGQPTFILIGLNILTFFLFGLFHVLVSFGWIPTSWSGFLARLTELPAEWQQFIRRPWTVLTYMFVHHHFFHLLFNLLWLFWMGQIFSEFFSNKLFYRMFFGGGILGAIVFLVLFPLIPVFSQVISDYYLVGASAGVSAIVLGLAILLPNYSIHMMFLGRIPLKYLAIGFIVLDLLSLGGANPGGSLAHLGGGLFGVICALQEQGKIPLNWFSKVNRSKRRKLKVVHSAKKPSSGTNPEPTQEVIDQILDKISKSGYDGLSSKEKELLFKASKREIKD